MVWPLILCHDSSRFPCFNHTDFLLGPSAGHILSYQSESESLVPQLCPTLLDSMHCSLPDSSVHGILQARILEWVAIPFSRGSSQPKNQTHVSGSPPLAGRFFITSTQWTEEPGRLRFLGLQRIRDDLATKQQEIWVSPIVSAQPSKHLYGCFCGRKGELITDNHEWGLPWYNSVLPIIHLSAFFTLW